MLEGGGDDGEGPCKEKDDYNFSAMKMMMGSCIVDDDDFCANLFLSEHWAEY